MSIWTARTDLLGRRRCKRCDRMFQLRKEGQKYGPKCARKVAQIPVEERLDTLPPEQEHPLDRFGAD